MLSIRIFMSVFLIFFMGSIACASPPDINKVVAIVNSVEITQGELNAEVGRLLPTTFFHQTVDDEKRRTLQKKAMDSLIEKELKIQAGKRLNLKVPKDVIDQEVEKVIARYPSSKDFEQNLKALNFTMANVRQAIESKKLAEMAYEHEVVGSVNLTDKELSEYYENNKAKFIEPFKYHLKNILLRIPPLANEKERDDIRLRAETIVAEIAKGLDFADAVEKYSEGADKEKGGDMGLLHKGRMAPEIEKEIQHFVPGEVKGPFQAFKGFYIFRLEAIYPEKQLSYDEVKEKLKESLSQKRIEEREKEWLQELQTKASIQFPE